MNVAQTFAKLEWPVLVDHISSLARTTDGKTLCQNLQPVLEAYEIESKWQILGDLKELINIGMRPPLTELIPIKSILRAIEVGQILSGEELRIVMHLIDNGQKIIYFCRENIGRCRSLEKIRQSLTPLPNLLNAIERAVDPDGNLKDDASKELAQIRQQKRHLRKKIEDKLRELFQNQDIISYLQEDFFTVRSERYVIPIKLDGRGRVKGTVIDTSASGQTLFIEPPSIAPLNEVLLDLELSEKLEMIKIFQMLTTTVGKETIALLENYNALIDFDFLVAQAEFCLQIKGQSFNITSEKCIKLFSARHPLLAITKETNTVSNDIALTTYQTTLIISGPNAGGKTVVLKTLGLILLMAKAGLLVPVGDDSECFLYDNVFVEMGDAQNLSANLSTFSGHVFGLLPIVNKASDSDLVLLDELAVGTEPNTGAAIAQAVLEHLSAKKVTTFVTTHFDNLKSLALRDKHFRNGSMEYALSSLAPTYKLILDVPGQSYGLEVAEKTGLNMQIIQRAKELRGKESHALDKAISDLMLMREELQTTKNKFETSNEEANQEKIRWQQELKLIESKRKEAADKAYEKYMTKFKDLEDEFQAILEEMRALRKKSKGDLPETSEWNDIKNEGLKKLTDFKKELGFVGSLNKEVETLPGRPCSFEELKVGDRVYINVFKKEGKITHLNEQAGQKIDVIAGSLKLQVSISGIRLLEKYAKPLQTLKTAHRRENYSQKPDTIFIQTATNTLDLRGTTVEAGLEKMWKFLDSSVLSGYPLVMIVHGHGTSALKTAIRSALQEKSPYKIQFQPGTREDGGDGVTLVHFE